VCGFVCICLLVLCAYVCVNECLRVCVHVLACTCVCVRKCACILVRLCMRVSYVCVSYVCVFVFARIRHLDV